MPTPRSRRPKAELTHEDVPQPWTWQAAAYARSLKPEPELGKLLVFGQGRTGSTLLGSLLGSHPQVWSADEVLGRPVLLPDRWVEGGRKAHAGEAYAIHVKIYQLRDRHGIHDVRGWLHDMHDRGWRIAFLWRENLFRHVLSNILVNERGRFHVTEAGGAPRVTVQVPELVHYMYARQRLREEEREALEGLPFEEVVYERDLLPSEQWQPTADRIFTQLGLPSAPVSTKLARTSTDDLTTLVSNLDEVREVLSRIGWEHYLGEAATSRARPSRRERSVAGRSTSR